MKFDVALCSNVDYATQAALRCNTQNRISCDAAGCRLVFVSLRWSSLPAAKVDESKIAICGVCGDVLLKSLELGPSSIVTVCNVQTEV